LHFTEELLQRLEAVGVGTVRVTLHVGPGTFRPVKTVDIDRHCMHAERYRLTPEAAGRINTARASGGRVVAVGTTSTRVLETLAGPDGRVTPGEGLTDIFIRPPHAFRAVDALITNFHLPCSTLLMLVCAFAGIDFTMATYAEAVRSGYRFYSYGDCSLVV
jgi:S-adenosylmethionine:tRNA ribosyltransferase-isomerase